MIVSILFNFIFTKEKEVYRQIAEKYRTSAWNVYKIANGKTIRSMKEGCVYRELFRRSIIS
jgi:hypothetical protein